MIAGTHRHVSLSVLFVVASAHLRVSVVDDQGCNLSAT
jgi:hypothetical protein